MLQRPVYNRESRDQRGLTSPPLRCLHFKKKRGDLSKKRKKKQGGVRSRGGGIGPGKTSSLLQAAYVRKPVIETNVEVSTGKTSDKGPFKPPLQAKLMFPSWRPRGGLFGGATPDGAPPWQTTTDRATTKKTKES